MTVISPGDPLEVEAAVEFSHNHQGPVYIRIAGKGEPNIHVKNFKFEIGKGIVVNQGGDVTLMVTGNMLANAFETAKLLGKRGISVRLISMPFIKPIDKNIILKSAKETKAIFTFEEHSIIGGLGSAVAEVLAESKMPKVLFKRIGLPDVYPSKIGSWDYLREIYGFLPGQLAEHILKIYKNKG